jgi:hypothetical protein
VVDDFNNSKFPWLLFNHQPISNTSFYGVFQSLKILTLDLLPLVMLFLSTMCPVRVLHVEVVKLKNTSKGKCMMFIEPFRMFGLLTYRGLNLWLKMVLLTKCVAKRAQPLKARKEYWQPS